MKNISVSILVLAVIWATPTISQEQLGLKISNYSGINAVSFNPAWNVNGILKWDVNLVSLGIFAHQNYMYGQKGSIVKVLNQGAEFITNESEVTNDASTSTAVPIYFDNNHKYYAHHNAFVMAPSFLFQHKKQTFGVSIQGRSWVSGYHLDEDLNYYNLTDTFSTIRAIEPFQIGVMAWGEIGANYGRNIKSNRVLDINIGGTLKFLLGYEGINISNKTTTNVIRGNDAIILDQTNLEFSYASNYTEEESYHLKRNGFGLAADLGVTFINKNTKIDKVMYKWKIGISLLDFGRIRYHKNASNYTLVSNDTAVYSLEPFEEIRDVDDIIEAINVSGNDIQPNLKSNQFGMWMPMAVGVQFDAPIIDRLYISGSAIIGMHFKGAAIERSDLIAVTPRFEMKWFEIGIPISLFRWTKLNMGTYIRMGPLTIGTESLNSWFIPGKLEGSDIYLSLKINSAMFNKNDNSNRNESGCYSHQF